VLADAAFLVRGRSGGVLSWQAGGRKVLDERDAGFRDGGALAAFARIMDRFRRNRDGHAHP